MAGVNDPATELNSSQLTARSWARRTTDDMEALVSRYHSSSSGPDSPDSLRSLCEDFGAEPRSSNFNPNVQKEFPPASPSPSSALCHRHCLLTVSFADAPEICGAARRSFVASSSNPSKPILEPHTIVSDIYAHQTDIAGDELTSFSNLDTLKFTPPTIKRARARARSMYDGCPSAVMPGAWPPSSELLGTPHRPEHLPNSKSSMSKLLRRFSAVPLTGITTSFGLHHSGPEDQPSEDISTIRGTVNPALDTPHLDHVLSFQKRLSLTASDSESAFLGLAPGLKLSSLSDDSEITKFTGTMGSLSAFSGPTDSSVSTRYTSDSHDPPSPPKPNDSSEVTSPLAAAQSHVHPAAQNMNSSAVAAVESAPITPLLGPPSKIELATTPGSSHHSSLDTPRLGAEPSFSRSPTQGSCSDILQISSSPIRFAASPVSADSLVTPSGTRRSQGDSRLFVSYVEHERRSKTPAVEPTGRWRLVRKIKKLQGKIGRIFRASVIRAGKRVKVEVLPGVGARITTFAGTLESGEHRPPSPAKSFRRQRRSAFSSVSSIFKAQSVRRRNGLDLRRLDVPFSPDPKASAFRPSSSPQEYFESETRHAYDRFIEDLQDHMQSGIVASSTDPNVLSSSTASPPQACPIADAPLAYPISRPIIKSTSELSSMPRRRSALVMPAYQIDFMQSPDSANRESPSKLRRALSDVGRTTLPQF